MSEIEFQIPKERDKRSFILQFTNDGGAEEQGLWKGRLQDVETGQHLPFGTLEALIERLSGFDVTLHHRKSHASLCSTCIAARHIGKDRS